MSRDERRGWNAWAKNNPVLLDDGNVRRVSGHKAMTMVLRNRTVAGQATDPTRVPAPAVWLDGALTTTEAGPFVISGFVGFRAGDDGLEASKWFVWATPPLVSTTPEPLKALRFVGAFDFAEDLPIEPNELTADIGGVFASVCGELDPPGGGSLWTPPHTVWFRLHHYYDGQLSPGRVLGGQIEEEN